MAFVAGRWDAERLVGVGLMVGVGVLCVVVLGVGAYSGVGLLASPPPIPSAFVKLTTERSHGSATHIGNGLYVTAAHVVDGFAEVALNGQPGVVLWSNAAYDIALVSGPGDAASVSLSCANLNIGDVAQAHGNPMDLDDITTTLTVAGSAREIGPWKVAVPMDGTMAPGMSGGGVVMVGALVGVNVGLSVAPVSAFSGSFYGISIVVPSSVVCALMGRV